MILGNLFYILTIFLILVCCIDFFKDKIVDNRIKILILIIILFNCLHKTSENFGIFKSFDTNEIKDTGNIFYENSSLNYKDVEIKDLPYDTNTKLSIFSENECKPECCPSQYSCDRGCICLTENQKKYLNRST